MNYNKLIWLFLIITAGVFGQDEYYITDPDGGAKIFTISGKNAHPALASHDIYFVDGIFSNKINIDGAEYSLGDFRKFVEDELKFQIVEFHEEQVLEPTLEIMTEESLHNAVLMRLNIRDPSTPHLLLVEGKNYWDAKGATPIAFEDIWSSKLGPDSAGSTSIIIDTHPAIPFSNPYPVAKGVEDFERVIILNFEQEFYNQFGSDVGPAIQAARPILLKEAKKWISVCLDVYLTAMTITVPGGSTIDAVITVADVLDGNYLSAAVAMAPFAGEFLGAGRKIVFKFTGTSVTFTKETATLLKKIRDLPPGTTAAVRLNLIADAVVSCEGWVAKTALGRHFCFPAGTLVDTPSGRVPIETLKFGECVTTLDFDQEVVTHRTSTGATQVGRASVYCVEYRTVDGVLGRITSTGDHPFYVVPSSPEAGSVWIECLSLNAGDSLLLRDGSTAEVCSVALVGNDVEVYELTVWGTENYFVGDHGVLVHNSDCVKKELRKLKNEHPNVKNIFDFMDAKGWDADASSLEFVRALLVKLPNGNMNPNKKIIGDRMRKVSPRQPGNLATGNKLHEWLPLANIDEAAEAIDDIAEWRKILYVLREARTPTDEMVFTKIPRNADGKHFGHSGALNTDLSMQWAFHAELNQAFGNSLDKTTGKFDMNKWRTNTESVIGRWFQPTDAKSILTNLNYVVATYNPNTYWP